MGTAIEAHCRRVAALACEMAARLGVCADTVCKAALLHHHAGPEMPDTDLEPSSAALRNLNFAVASAGSEAEQVDPLIRSIIEVAHAFDERLELAAYIRPDAGGIVDELKLPGVDPRVIESLHSLRIRSLGVPSTLAVCPAVLLRAVNLLGDEDASPCEIERIIQSDQVLASSLLSIANAALYAPVAAIKTIGRAIAHIGTFAARKIIIAAAARPLFASAKVQRLWVHSLEVATIAERLARTTGVADSAEAFVAGLIHDIGRLAVESDSSCAAETHRRIAEDAQCAVLADMVVLGCDHGEYGARILENWGLPADLTNAIAFHHRPELTRDVLPKILYLAEFVAEFVADTEEDIASAVRLKSSMSRVGVQCMGDLLERGAFDKRIASILALAG